MDLHNGNSTACAGSSELHRRATEDAADVLVRVRNLTVEFPGKEGPKRVLDSIDFDIRDGEFVTIVGASGSGKTTLLRCLDGLVTPAAGSIEMGGVPVAGPDRARGFVFQSDCLLPWRTILDNVAFGLEVQGAKRSDARARAREMLELTGLGECEGQHPAELSGGMRQRVNVARALAVDPQMLLMDEPFAALDAQTREVLQMELLTIWGRRRKTVAFVTHQLDEAVYLADRVIVLATNPGRIRAALEVDLPRPRSLDIKHTPRFGELVNELWDLIKKEIINEAVI